MGLGFKNVRIQVACAFVLMLKLSLSRDEVMVMDAYINRCIFGTRYMKERELVYDLLKCYGCGLFVPTCPHIHKDDEKR
jgi:hypothetical protein